MTKELARLRKENEILRQEREILKRAATFFRESGNSPSVDYAQFLMSVKVAIFPGGDVQPAPSRTGI